MFKRISLLLFLIMFLFGCTNTLLKPDETEGILEDFKQHIISEGLGEPYIVEDDELWDPGYRKGIKAEKQWIWTYEKKFGVASGILSCKILLIRFTDPFQRKKLENFKWVVFPRTLYWEGGQAELKETVDHQFYHKLTLYAHDLDQFLGREKPPARTSDKSQVLLDIIWYAVKDFHKKNKGG